MPVQPDYIKKTGNKLIRRYPSAVSTDFKHNKNVVGELTNISSKKVRNQVAGYITRKARQIENSDDEII